MKNKGAGAPLPPKGDTLLLTCARLKPGLDFVLLSDAPVFSRHSPCRERDKQDVS
jgi:hypothetical protein